PTLSDDAFQVTVAVVAVREDAARPVGTDGAELSSPGSTSASASHRSTAPMFTGSVVPPTHSTTEESDGRDSVPVDTRTTRSRADNAATSPFTEDRAWVPVWFPRSRSPALFACAA